MAPEGPGGSGGPPGWSPGASAGRVLRPLAALVSESASRVLVATPPEAGGQLEVLAGAAGVPAARLGATGGDRLVVTGLLDLPLSRLRDAYEGALPRALGEAT